MSVQDSILAKERKKRKKFSIHFVTGALSGVISKTVTSPLERLKVLRQISSSEYKELTVSQSFWKMLRLEGFKGFFKGNGSNLARVAPNSACQFFFYEFYKHHLFDDQKSSSYSSKLLCGGLTGTTASTLTYPLNLIRTILTVNVNPKGQKLGIWSCGSDIYRREGFIGLYKGWFPTMLGNAPYIAIKMSIFDMLKSHFHPQKTHPYADLLNLSLGSLSGTIAVTLTYPTDIIRKQMQLSGMEGHNKYNSLTECIKQIAEKEGFKGFFKGLLPCYMKVIPGTAILFMTNEKLKRWFLL